ncbi:MAG: hypothetical protein A2846_00345 [Candidatus Doudnabacteria bacterium RIFCSPHIGHO2_01_FULL_49_9]|uniref:Antitoxin n=1 Tax=Candidatus Doudnabacteria bacterium RIFCSPHIGHO2_01_FULL_49_9 TaxID=1817827 RepID=A0A1F5NY75_9BACT|nr:MAG: hypothetical protein A2846_00345 [Candidatus Doudnabacteria bacterium RIFCSPHIGHO2_01_FULL_49_9]
MHQTIVGLKEFRENVESFAKRVSKGRSFIVVKRSKPIFRVAPLDEVERWETVVDFTKIKKGGIPAEVMIKYLANGQTRKKSSKA